MYQQYIISQHHSEARILVHPATLLYQQGCGQKIRLCTHQGIHYVLPQQILYCKAESNYCHVVLQSGERIFVSKTLKWINEQLPDATFIRPHASWLINVFTVNTLRRDAVVLNDGTQIPVARSKSAAVRRRLAQEK